MLLREQCGLMELEWCVQPGVESEGLANLAAER